METDIFNQEQIIQIDLYQHEQLTFKKIIQIISIGLLVVLSISSVAFYYFNLEILTIVIGVIALMIIALLVFSQFSYYTTVDDVTLVIAFGEFQLMQNKKILWCEKIDLIDFEYNHYSDYQIPIILLQGTAFSKISIGYGRPKNTKTTQKLNYMIFSKLDWKILKQYANITIPIEFNDDNTQIKKR